MHLTVRGGLGDSIARIIRFGQTDTERIYCNYSFPAFLLKSIEITCGKKPTLNPRESTYQQGGLKEV
jgi:hypothetical protein